MNSKLYVRSMVSDDTPIDIYKKVINAYMYLLSLILSFLKKSIKTAYYMNFIKLHFAAKTKNLAITCW